jgi:hypothetical protein
MLTPLATFYDLKIVFVAPGKSYCRGRLNTVDLLVLTSLDLLLFISKLLHTNFTKLNEEVIRTEPSPSVSIPLWRLQPYLSVWIALKCRSNG